jgi:hypothetical protein
MMSGLDALEQSTSFRGTARAPIEAMARNRRTLALVMMTLAAGLPGSVGSAGCQEPDPNYGSPQVLKGREVDFGTDAGAAPVPEAAPSGKPANELFAELFVTMTDTGQAKGSTCLPCHGTTQAPVFMAATAEETRTKFKAAGYEKLATSRFYLKGAHTGRELTPAQKTLTQQWAAAEAGGSAPGGGG